MNGTIQKKKSQRLARIKSGPSHLVYKKKRPAAWKELKVDRTKEKRSVIWQL